MDKFSYNVRNLNNYTYCPVEKEVYRKQIIKKIKILDHKTKFTLAHCNSPPNNIYGKETCCILWNDIQDYSNYISYLKTDLGLME